MYSCKILIAHYFNYNHRFKTSCTWLWSITFRFNHQRFLQCSSCLHSMNLDFINVDVSSVIQQQLHKLASDWLRASDDGVLRVQDSIVVATEIYLSFFIEYIFCCHRNCHYRVSKRFWRCYRHKASNSLHDSKVLNSLFNFHMKFTNLFHNNHAKRFHFPLS